MLLRRITTLLALATIAAGIAHGATLPEHDPNWRQPVAEFDDSSPPTEAVAANGWVFYAAGTALYGRDSSSGNRIALPYPTGARIEKAPALAKLADGRWYVFVASGDGKLYKFDVYNSILTGSMQIAKAGGVNQIRDLKRPSSIACTVKDTLTTSPVVQLAAVSNGDYSLGKDLVMVPTHHGCGQTTTNKLVAFDAADITQPALWVMNDGGEYSIDYWDSCILEYARNRIYCGANLATGSFQNTIWSIDTVSGSLVWAANVGAVRSRAALGQSAASPIDHLYVADAAARLHALDPASGAEHWVLPLTGVPGIGATAEVSVGRGAYAGLILVTTDAGQVIASFDGGAGSADGEILWATPRAAQRAITRAEVPGPNSMAYVGFDDGSVHLLNLATGADEGYVTVDNLPPHAAGSVSRATISSYHELTTNRLLVARAGVAGDPSNGTGSVTTQLVLPGPDCIVESADVALDGTVTLRIEIGGTNPCTQYDRYIVQRALSIEGARLQLVLINGFIPAAGQRFEILQWGTLGGSFDTIDTTQAQLGAGLSWDTSRLYTTGELVVANSSPPMVVPAIASWQAAVLSLLLIGITIWRTRHNRD